MTNALTIESPTGIRTVAVRGRPTLELSALRAYAMPRWVPDAHAPKRARFDFDAALLALIFAGQFAVTAVGAAQALGALTEPHVDAPAIVAAAHGARAP